MSESEFRESVCIVKIDLSTARPYKNPTQLTYRLKLHSYFIMKVLKQHVSITDQLSDYI